LASLGACSPTTTPSTPDLARQTQSFNANSLPTPQLLPSVFTSTTSISLPADDAPHPEYTTEWWYYNGNVANGNGEEVAFHFVVFQVRLPNSTHAQIAHASIINSVAGSYTADQRGNFVLQSPPPTEGFALTVGDWSMSGSNGKDTIVFTVGSRKLRRNLLSCTMATASWAWARTASPPITRARA
jgi:predicted secreted hydrolase